MLGIGAGKAEFCLQRNIVCKSSLKTLLNRILRRINEVVDKFELVIVPRVFDGENLLEYLVQTFVFPAVRSGLQLEEILEGLQLNLQKVRIFQDFGSCEVYSLVGGLF